MRLVWSILYETAPLAKQSAKETNPQVVQNDAPQDLYDKIKTLLDNARLQTSPHQDCKAKCEAHCAARKTLNNIDVKDAQEQLFANPEQFLIQAQFPINVFAATTIDRKKTLLAQALIKNNPQLAQQLFSLLEHLARLKPPHPSPYYFVGDLAPHTQNNDHDTAIQRHATYTLMAYLSFLNKKKASKK